jgi:hypothetical protein
MEKINAGLKNTRLDEEVDMNVDLPPESPSSRMLDAKRRALSKFVCLVFTSGSHLVCSRDDEAPGSGASASGTLTLEEAINLERQAFLQDKERQERITEKKRRLGMPIKGEVMSQKEREARIWAFM